PRLDEAEFKRRFRTQFQDPAFAPLAAELDRITAAAWDAYAHSRKSPKTRKAGPGFCRSELRARARLDRCARRDPSRAAAARRGRRSAPHPADQRFIALGAHLSERDVEELSAVSDRAWRLCRRRRDGRLPRPVAARVGIRPSHSSLQGVLLD